MENVLKKIINKKKEKIKICKKDQSENRILEKIKKIDNFINSDPELLFTADKSIIFIQFVLK